MAATTLPRTSHRLSIRLVVALVATAMIVTALLVARSHRPGTAAKRSNPVVRAIPTPAHVAADDWSCFTMRPRGHAC